MTKSNMYNTYTLSILCTYALMFRYVYTEYIYIIYYNITHSKQRLLYYIYIYIFTYIL